MATAMVVLGLAAAGPAWAQQDAPLPEESLSEMAVGRARLEVLLAEGARQRHPELVALAEDHFECWVLDAGGSGAADGAVRCRRAFLSEVRRLETLEAGAGEIGDAAPLAFWTKG